MPDSFFDNKNINDIINDHLAEKIEFYGDVKYAYAIINKENPIEMMVLTNHADWVELYLKNNYQLVDPVIIKCLSSVESFLWDEDIMFKAQYKLPMIFRMGKNYDIKSGCTFVLHDYNNNMALLSIMMGEHCREETKTSILNDRDRLQSLLISAHTKILSLYQEESEIIQQEKKKPGLLTSRENDVLYLASQGKTYSEIACSLKVKEVTVKFHMANVVKKLGVMNAKHAINLGIELKLIHPVITDNE
uniref:PanR n=1 Tax=Pantoea sp. CWB304 TaxID=543533 RepID=B3VN68_9GAMM|nr:PanR [Pantoea sp. CWB304]